MTSFLLAAGLLVAFAMAFVVPALLRGEQWEHEGPAAVHLQRNMLNLAVLRDQLRELDADFQAGAIDAAAYRSTREELERCIAENAGTAPLPSRSAQPRLWSVVVMVIALPVTAAFLYAMLGTPKALLPYATVALDEGRPSVGAAEIEAMVTRLAGRLKTNPDDASGWRMLARSYETMRRFDAAVDAYKHLLALEPNNADALTDAAVALAMSTNQSLSGEPERLIDRALAIDPNHLQALALSGSAVYERGEYAKAIPPWKRILSIAPADSDMTKSIADSIAKAEARAAPATSTGERSPDK